MLTFRAVWFEEPKHLPEIVTFQKVGLGMDLRINESPYCLVVPRPTSGCHVSERPISLFAPHLFNELPVSMKGAVPLEAFVSKLKSFFFLRAYNLHGMSLDEDFCV